MALATAAGGGHNAMISSTPVGRVGLDPHVHNPHAPCRYLCERHGPSVVQKHLPEKPLQFAGAPRHRELQVFTITLRLGIVLESN